MRRQYKRTKMPLEAYKRFLDKKTSMEKDIFTLTGKKKINWTDFFNLVSSKPLFIENYELKTIAKRRGRR